MRARLLPSGRSLPLVVEPEDRIEAGRNALIAWLTGESAWLDQHLLRHGAVLLRGFDLGVDEDFVALTDAVAPELAEYVRGTTPRSQVRGRIYTSTDAPAFLPIPLHNEMSYSDAFPARVMFFCHTAPREGGETPVADMRRVWRRVDPAVRERFARDGVALVQNVRPRRGAIWWLKPWPEMFGTEDPAAVERACAEQKVDLTWLPDGSLRLTNRRPAAIPHPVTGETCWFNSANTFHDSWSSELARSGRPWLAAAARLGEGWRGLRLPPEEHPRQATYGDGSPIPREHIEHVRDVLWAEAVRFRWQRGDLLLLDNVLASHGRTPFRGARRILAALVPFAALPTHPHRPDVREAPTPA